MRHEPLWAPWRLGYVSGTEADRSGETPESELNWLPEADHQCFICRDLADREERDRQNLLAYRGDEVVVILNRYPYNNGHLLIAPRLHRATLDVLSDQTLLECQRMVARCVRILSERMNAEGFNVGLNLGRVAGAGLPGHLHWHVVPRWNGDTNFMPVLAGIRVIPQSLDALWELMHEALTGSERGGSH